MRANRSSLLCCLALVLLALTLIPEVESAKIVRTIVKRKVVKSPIAFFGDNVAKVKQSRFTKVVSRKKIIFNEVRTGKISAVGNPPILMSTTNVGEVADYTFKFKAANTIDANGFIIINFPHKYAKGLGVTGDCAASIFAGQTETEVPCTIKNRRVRINVVSLDAGLIVIKIKGVLNPSQSRGAGNFRIETRKKSRIVDRISKFYNPSFSRTKVSFSAATFKFGYTGRMYCGASPVLHFTWTNTMKIPSRSWFRLTFPNGVKYNNPRVVLLNAQAKWRVVLRCSAHKNVFKCKNIPRALAKDGKVKLKIWGVVMPEVAGATGSYGFEILERGTNTVFIGKTDVGGQEIRVGKFKNFRVRCRRREKAAETDCGIHFQSTNTIEQGGKITITFPIEFENIASTCRAHGLRPIKPKKCSNPRRKSAKRRREEAAAAAKGQTAADPDDNDGRGCWKNGKERAAMIKPVTCSIEGRELTVADFETFKKGKNRRIHIKLRLVMPNIDQDNTSSFIIRSWSWSGTAFIKVGEMTDAGRVHVRTVKAPPLVKASLFKPVLKSQMGRIGPLDLNVYLSTALPATTGNTVGQLHVTLPEGFKPVGEKMRCKFGRDNAKSCSYNAGTVIIETPANRGFQDCNERIRITTADGIKKNGKKLRGFETPDTPGSLKFVIKSYIIDKTVNTPTTDPDEDDEGDEGEQKPYEPEDKPEPTEETSGTQEQEEVAEEDTTVDGEVPYTPTSGAGEEAKVHFSWTAKKYVHSKSSIIITLEGTGWDQDLGIGAQYKKWTPIRCSFNDSDSEEVVVKKFSKSKKRVWKLRKSLRRFRKRDAAEKAEDKENKNDDDGDDEDEDKRKPRCKWRNWWKNKKKSQKSESEKNYRLERRAKRVKCRAMGGNGTEAPRVFISGFGRLVVNETISFTLYQIKNGTTVNASSKIRIGVAKNRNWKYPIWISRRTKTWCRKIRTKVTKTWTRRKITWKSSALGGDKTGACSVSRGSFSLTPEKNLSPGDYVEFEFPDAFKLPRRGIRSNHGLVVVDKENNKMTVTFNKSHQANKEIQIRVGRKWRNPFKKLTGDQKVVANLYAKGEKIDEFEIDQWDDVKGSGIYRMKVFIRNRASKAKTIIRVRARTCAGVPEGGKIVYTFPDMIDNIEKCEKYDHGFRRKRGSNINCAVNGRQVTVTGFKAIRPGQKFVVRIKVNLVETTYNEDDSFKIETYSKESDTETLEESDDFKLDQSLKLKKTVKACKKISFVKKRTCSRRRVSAGKSAEIAFKMRTTKVIKKTTKDKTSSGFVEIETDDDDDEEGMTLNEGSKPLCYLANKRCSKCEYIRNKTTKKTVIRMHTSRTTDIAANTDVDIKVSTTASVSKYGHGRKRGFKMCSRGGKRQFKISSYATGSAGGVSETTGVVHKYGKRRFKKAKINFSNTEPNSDTDVKVTFKNRGRCGGWKKSGDYQTGEKRNKFVFEFPRSAGWGESVGKVGFQGHAPCGIISKKLKPREGRATVKCKLIKGRGNTPCKVELSEFQDIEDGEDVDIELPGVKTPAVEGKKMRIKFKKTVQTKTSRKVTSISATQTEVDATIAKLYGEDNGPEPKGLEKLREIEDLVAEAEEKGETYTPEEIDDDSNVKTLPYLKQDLEDDDDEDEGEEWDSEDEEEDDGEEVKQMCGNRSRKWKKRFGSRILESTEQAPSVGGQQEAGTRVPITLNVSSSKEMNKGDTITWTFPNGFLPPNGAMKCSCNWGTPDECNGTVVGVGDTVGRCKLTVSKKITAGTAQTCKLENIRLPAKPPTGDVNFAANIDVKKKRVEKITYEKTTTVKPTPKPKPIPEDFNPDETVPLVSNFAVTTSVHEAEQLSAYTFTFTIPQLIYGRKKKGQIVFNFHYEDWTEKLTKSWRGTGSAVICDTSVSVTRYNRWTAPFCRFRKGNKSKQEDAQVILQYFGDIPAGSTLTITLFDILNPVQNKAGRISIWGRWWEESVELKYACQKTYTEMQAFEQIASPTVITDVAAPTYGIYESYKYSTLEFSFNIAIDLAAGDEIFFVQKQGSWINERNLKFSGDAETFELRVFRSTYFIALRLKKAFTAGTHTFGFSGYRTPRTYGNRGFPWEVTIIKSFRFVLHYKFVRTQLFSYTPPPPKNHGQVTQSNKTANAKGIFKLKWSNSVEYRVNGWVRIYVPSHFGKLDATCKVKGFLGTSVKCICNSAKKYVDITAFSTIVKGTALELHLSGQNPNNNPTSKSAFKLYLYSTWGNPKTIYYKNEELNVSWEVETEKASSSASFKWPVVQQPPAKKEEVAPITFEYTPSEKLDAGLYKITIRCPNKCCAPATGATGVACKFTQEKAETAEDSTTAGDAGDDESVNSEEDDSPDEVNTWWSPESTWDSKKHEIVVEGSDQKGFNADEKFTVECTTDSNDLEKVLALNTKKESASKLSIDANKYKKKSERTTNDDDDDEEDDTDDDEPDVETPSKDKTLEKLKKCATANQPEKDLDEDDDEDREIRLLEGFKVGDNNGKQCKLDISVYTIDDDTDEETLKEEATIEAEPEPETIQPIIKVSNHNAEAKARYSFRFPTCVELTGDISKFLIHFPTKNGDDNVYEEDLGFGFAAEEEERDISCRSKTLKFATDEGKLACLLRKGEADNGTAAIIEVFGFADLTDGFNVEFTIDNIKNPPKIDEDVADNQAEIMVQVVKYKAEAEEKAENPSGEDEEDDDDENDGDESADDEDDADSVTDDGTVLCEGTDFQAIDLIKDPLTLTAEETQTRTLRSSKKRVAKRTKYILPIDITETGGLDSTDSIIFTFPEEFELTTGAVQCTCYKLPDANALTFSTIASYTPDGGDEEPVEGETKTNSVVPGRCQAFADDRKIEFVPGAGYGFAESTSYDCLFEDSEKNLQNPACTIDINDAGKKMLYEIAQNKFVTRLGKFGYEEEFKAGKAKMSVEASSKETSATEVEYKITIDPVKSSKLKTIFVDIPAAFTALEAKCHIVSGLDPHEDEEDENDDPIPDASTATTNASDDGGVDAGDEVSCVQAANRVTISDFDTYEPKEDGVIVFTIKGTNASAAGKSDWFKVYTNCDEDADVATGVISKNEKADKLVLVTTPPTPKEVAISTGALAKDKRRLQVNQFGIIEVEFSLETKTLDAANSKLVIKLHKDFFIANKNKIQCFIGGSFLVTEKNDCFYHKEKHRIVLRRTAFAGLDDNCRTIVITTGGKGKKRGFKAPSNPGRYRFDLFLHVSGKIVESGRMNISLPGDRSKGKTKVIVETNKPAKRQVVKLRWKMPIALAKGYKKNADNANIDEDIGILVAQFVTDNGGWPVDLGFSGHTSGTAIPCQARRGLKFRGGRKILCRLFTVAEAGEGKYPYITVSNFEALKVGKEVVVKVPNIQNPVKKGVRTVIRMGAYTINTKFEKEITEWTLPPVDTEGGTTGENPDDKEPKIEPVDPATITEQLEFTNTTCGGFNTIKFPIKLKYRLRKGQDKIRFELPNFYDLTEGGYVTKAWIETIFFVVEKYSEQGWIVLSPKKDIEAGEWTLHIGPIRNPKWVISTTYSFVLYTIINTNIIETYTYNNLPASTPADVLDPKVEITSYKARANNVRYKFYFKLSYRAPTGGKIELDFSSYSDISALDPAPRITLSESLLATSQFVNTKWEGQKLIIYDYEEVAEGSLIVITMKKMKNPLTEATHSVTLKIYDSSSNVIYNYIFGSIVISAADDAASVTVNLKPSTTFKGRKVIVEAELSTNKAIPEASTITVQLPSEILNDEGAVDLAEYGVDSFAELSGVLFDDEDPFKPKARFDSNQPLSGISYDYNNKRLTMKTGEDIARGIRLFIRLSKLILPETSSTKSESFVVTVVNNGETIAQNDQSSDQSKILYSSLPDPVELTVTGKVKPRTEGLLAKYTFEFQLPAKVDSYKSSIKIRFPESQYEDDLAPDGKEIKCKGLEGFVDPSNKLKCLVSNSEITIFDYDSLAQGTIRIRIKNVINPDGGKTKKFSFYIHNLDDDYLTYIGEDKVDFDIIDSPEKLNFRAKPVIDVINTKTQLNFWIQPTQAPINANDSIVIDLPKEYVDSLDLDPCVISAPSGDNQRAQAASGSTLACEFDEDATEITITGFDTIAAYTEGENDPANEPAAHFLVTVVTPSKPGETGELTCSVEDPTDQVTQRGYGSTNLVTTTYFSPGYPINVEAIPEVPIGTHTIELEVELSVPATWPIELTPWEFSSESFKVVPDKLTFAIGERVQPFKIVVQRENVTDPTTVPDGFDKKILRPLVGPHKIKWYKSEVKGSDFADARDRYVPAADSTFQVIDQGNFYVHTEEVSEIPLGGESQPITVRLERPTEARLIVNLATQSPVQDNDIQFSPTELTFEKGEYSKTFVLKPTKDAASGFVGFTLAGPMKDQYYIPQDHAERKFTLQDSDSKAPTIIDYGVTFIGQVELHGKIVTDEPFVAWWIISPFGTDAPTLPQVKNQEKNFSESLPAWFGKSVSTAGSIARLYRDGLSSSTKYSCHFFTVDQNDNSSGPFTFYFTTLQAVAPVNLQIVLQQNMQMSLLIQQLQQLLALKKEELYSDKNKGDEKTVDNNNGGNGGNEEQEEKEEKKEEEETNEEETTGTDPDPDAPEYDKEEEEKEAEQEEALEEDTEDTTGEGYVENTTDPEPDDTPDTDSTPEDPEIDGKEKEMEDISTELGENTEDDTPADEVPPTIPETDPTPPSVVDEQNQQQEEQDEETVVITTETTYEITITGELGSNRTPADILEEMNERKKELQGKLKLSDNFNPEDSATPLALRVPHLVAAPVVVSQTWDSIYVKVEVEWEGKLHGCAVRRGTKKPTSYQLNHGLNATNYDFPEGHHLVQDVVVAAGETQTTMYYNFTNLIEYNPYDMYFSSITEVAGATASTYDDEVEGVESYTVRENTSISTKGAASAAMHLEIICLLMSVLLMFFKF